MARKAVVQPVRYKYMVQRKNRRGLITPIMFRCNISFTTILFAVVGNCCEIERNQKSFDANGSCCLISSQWVICFRAWNLHELCL